jgi:MFS transporter, AAHS family, 4-hydroxybenzoate transporter
VGATIGPMVGGYLIEMKLPQQQLFMIATIPLAIGVVVAGVITPLYRKQVIEAEGGAPMQDYVEPDLPLGGHVAGEAL